MKIAILGLIICSSFAFGKTIKSGDFYRPTSYGTGYEVTAITVKNNICVSSVIGIGGRNGGVATDSECFKIGDKKELEKFSVKKTLIKKEIHRNTDYGSANEVKIVTVSNKECLVSFAAIGLHEGKVSTSISCIKD